MKLKEIFNKDLTGWQIMPVYSIELKHTLMGYFPLIVENTKTIVWCTNRDDLKKIWETLERNEVKVNKAICMVNLQEKLMIPVDSREEENASSDGFLLITDDIEKHLKETKFDYAFGLIGSANKHATFPEEKSPV